VDRLEDAIALAIEAGRWRGREDSVAFGMPLLKSSPCSSSTPAMNRV
jgi:hypothetical protein